MGEISIKINISDRTYPLKVGVDEEELIRKAAKNVNERIKEFGQTYSVKDKQDLLSMTVLHFATECLKIEKNLLDDEQVATKIVQIDHLLSEYLLR